MAVAFKVLQKKVSDLRPYPGNPRVNDEAVDAVARSIERFGFQVPIICDKKLVIIAGHTRWKAAQKLNLDKVPVRIVELSEDDARAYRIADNQLASIADWDEDKLHAELSALKLKDFDLSLLGFDDDWLVRELAEEKEFLTDADDVPDVPKKPKTKPGDVYLLGQHRLICGDSTKIPTWNSLIAKNTKCSLLLTDPPYGVSYAGSDGTTIANDDIVGDTLREFLRDSLGPAFEHLAPGSTYYIWHADSQGYAFRGCLVDLGVELRQTLIWVKDRLVLGRQDYHWKHEPCLSGEVDGERDPLLDVPDMPEDLVDHEFQEGSGKVHDPCLTGWKDGAAHRWFSDRKQDTVLEFARPSKSAEHPTMKPVELLEYLMVNSSLPGEVVIDPFLGSGSTLIAAEKQGRTCFGIELEPKFCDVIVKRWEMFTGLKSKKV